MQELDDIALLKQFAENGSEPAFAEIVSRHVNLVYSAALRKVGDAHAAQEISQAVFIILARKAQSLGAKTILSGWLHQTTRLTAANFLRGEIRRQKREQEAFMRSTLNEDINETWRQIAPVLDDAISKLGAKDRDAIVLRYFENKSLVEVGAAMGTGEDAAKMRVSRALEKLRKIFSKRGVRLSAALIAGAVSAKNNFRRGDGQRCGGHNLNLNTRKRSIENYGLDKNENGDCGRRGCIARGGNDDGGGERISTQHRC